MTLSILVRAVNAVGSAGTSSIASSWHQFAGTTDRGTATSMQNEVDMKDSHTTSETMMLASLTTTIRTGSADNVLPTEISMPAG